MNHQVLEKQDIFDRMSDYELLKKNKSLVFAGNIFEM
jgi:hypothetical protein